MIHSDDELLALATEVANSFGNILHINGRGKILPPAAPAFSAFNEYIERFRGQRSNIGQSFKLSLVEVDAQGQGAYCIIENDAHFIILESGLTFLASDIGLMMAYSLDQKFPEDHRFGMLSFIIEDAEDDVKHFNHETFAKLTSDLTMRQREIYFISLNSVILFVLCHELAHATDGHARLLLSGGRRSFLRDAGESALANPVSVETLWYIERMADICGYGNGLNCLLGDNKRFGRFSWTSDIERMAIYSASVWLLISTWNALDLQHVKIDKRTTFEAGVWPIVLNDSHPTAAFRFIGVFESIITALDGWDLDEENRGRVISEVMKHITKICENGPERSALFSLFRNSYGFLLRPEVFEAVSRQERERREAGLDTSIIEKNYNDHAVLPKDWSPKVI